MAAEDEDDKTRTQSGEGDSGTQSGSDSSKKGSTGTDGDKGTQSGTDTPDPKDVELAAVRERMKAADKRAAQLDAELKAIRDKDLPEAEKAKKDLAEATERAKELEAKLQRQAIVNAFLSNNKYTWHNPDRALKAALELELIDVDENGNVTGLLEALNKLAKDEPYLLKTSGDDSGEDEKRGGTTPGNNGSAGGGKTDANKLARRFPQLRTRMRTN